MNVFDITVPDLSHNPEAAVTQLEKLIADAQKNIYLLVGSSLGGCYATYLAEKYCCRAALINPAVSPVKYLGEEFLGPQVNLESGEEYDFTLEHANYLDSLDINPLLYPENYFLLVQKGDEVLDYQLAVDRYTGSLQIVQEGGSHRYEGFQKMIPHILGFAEHGTLTPEIIASISDI